MSTRLVSLALLSLAACGTAASAEPTAAEGAEGTSGGETATLSPSPIRRTTPVPVPQPVVAREELSEPLQNTWTLVEEAVAIRPPEPPADGEAATVEAWAAGPFTEWLGRRAIATQQAQQATEGLGEAPGYERGIAAGLIGYLQETTCAEVRGAPIATSIAQDPELLSIYSQRLDEALLPIARVAAQGYQFCVAGFEETGDRAWAEWAQYCNDRGAEVTSVYRIGSEPVNEPEKP